MKTTICALLALGLGCSTTHEPGAEAAPTKKKAAAKDPKMTTELTWSIAKQGDKLHVTYHFENHTGGVVYVNDGTVPQIGNDKFLKVTTNIQPSALDAETILLTVGTPAGDVPAAAGVAGFYVAVPKGGSFDGARDVLFPFQTRDAMGRVVPIAGKFKQARLALYVSDGEPAKWRELPTDGGKVRVPDAPSIRIIQTDPKPLP